MRGFILFPSKSKSKLMMRPSLQRIAWILGLFALLGPFPSGVSSQEKKLRVETMVSAGEVEPGDELTVRISVQGHSEIVNPALPVDLVFLIDRSWPVDEEKINMLRGILLRLIQLAERAGGQLSSRGIRIGLVALSSQGDLAIPPTNQLDALRALSEEMLLPGPEESSRLLEAMRRAQGFLVASPISQRAIVIFSEGILGPMPETQWMELWYSLFREAQTAGIRYYGIGWGSQAPASLLFSMAENSGGNYYHPANVTQLEAVIDDLFAHAAYHMAASQIILREEIDLSNFEIIPNSFEFSDGLLIPLPPELSRFARTGEIVIPLGQLPVNKPRVIGFRLRVKECLPPDHPQESIEIEPSRPGSGVSYQYGPLIDRAAIPPSPIRCYKPSGLFFWKDYDDAREELVITLRSTYRRSGMVDTTIRNIRVYEYPSLHYQYVPGSAIPALEKTIPGPKADLLHWFIPQLSPQEKVELRFKTQLSAYRPRDSNPLRLSAERRVEGCEPWAEYIAPGKTLQKILLPQKYRTISDLPFLPEGRPDLYIAPPMDEEKYLGRVPEEIDLSHIRIPPDGLTALWPFPQNILLGQESPDIWIDSEKNGFVDRWEPEADPAVVSQIKARIHHVIVNPITGAFQGIEGQGDLFHRKQKNRIYVRIHNTGEGRSPRLAQGLKLSMFNWQTREWDLVRTLDLPEVPPHSSLSPILFVELPSDSLKDAWLQPFGGSGKGAWTALLQISLIPSPHEAHTSNNTSTEKFFVVD